MAKKDKAKKGDGASERRGRRHGTGGKKGAKKPKKGKKAKKSKTAKTERRAAAAPVEDVALSPGKRNRALGERGEEAAERFLRRRGYDILERNWTCFAGEADIIAADERTLVFAEVKTRRGIARGFPGEAVGPDKRERYEKIALAYVQDHYVGEVAVRFDVISIVVVAPDRALVRHHLGAFSAG